MLCACTLPRCALRRRTSHALRRRLLRSFKDDDDFPTWDPYLNTTADMPVRRQQRRSHARRGRALTPHALAQTMRDVAEDFLRNKTIFFVGDSINGLVYQAAVRAALF